MRTGGFGASRAIRPLSGGTRLSFGLLLFLGSAGCSSSDAPGGDDDLAGGCDIHRRGCQEAVFAAAAALRRQTGARIPEVRTITVEEFAAELKRDSSKDGGPDTLTPTLTLLGLLDAGASASDAATETAVAGVAAFYDDVAKSVTVIDRGPSDSKLSDVFELAHEFVHSLQDASVDLAAFRKRWSASVDSYMAVTSLVEGEATVLGVGVLNEAAGAPVSTYRWSVFIEKMMTSIYDGLGSSGSPFFYATQMLPYPLGTLTLYQPWLDQGNGAISKLYANPMPSLLDWTELSGVGQPSLVEPLTCFPSRGPPGFTGVEHDTFGLVGVLALAVRLGFPGSDAFQHALEWRNDSVVLFRSDATPDSYAVAWRIRLASTAAIDVLGARGWDALGPGVSVTRFGNEFLVLGATDPTVLPTWTGASYCGSAAELPTAPEAGTTTTSALVKTVRHPGPGREGASFLDRARLAR